MYTVPKYRSKENQYNPTAFGMTMNERSFSGGNYRYGFNGKEKDNEINVDAGDYDYGARIQDARLGRFLSVDPLRKIYSWYSSYQFCGNKPIKFIDKDGLEESPVFVQDDILIHVINDKEVQDNAKRFHQAMKDAVIVEVGIGIGVGAKVTAGPVEAGAEAVLFSATQTYNSGGQTSTNVTVDQVTGKVSFCDVLDARATFTSFKLMISNPNELSPYNPNNRSIVLAEVEVEANMNQPTGIKVETKSDNVSINASANTDGILKAKLVFGFLYSSVTADLHKIGDSIKEFGKGVAGMFESAFNYMTNPGKTFEKKTDPNGNF